MRKLTIIISMLLLTVGVVCAANTITKKAGEYTVEATIDKNPPIAGKNNIDILVKDKSGKARYRRKGGRRIFHASNAGHACRELQDRCGPERPGL